jgi:transcriptional regulator with XRE-family HTH domain
VAGRCTADVTIGAHRPAAGGYVQGSDMNEPWDNQMEALGDFIRRQRKLANLSLRQLAEKTRLSNPYLSQIERGLHQPSMRVIKQISEALNVSAETLLTHAGVLHRPEAGNAAEVPEVPAVERAIDADPRLSDQQKTALISVYRSMLRVD